jgi:hypothetical protein
VIRAKDRNSNIILLMCLLSILAGRAGAASQVQQVSNYDIS